MNLNSMTNPKIIFPKNCTRYGKKRPGNSEFSHKN